LNTRKGKGNALVNPSLAQALDVSRWEMLKNPAFRNNTKRRPILLISRDSITEPEIGWHFTCNLRSKEVTIFNLNVTARNMNSQSPGISHKVAKTKSAGLPRFSLGRNSALHTFENVVDKICGEPKAPSTWMRANTRNSLHISGSEEQIQDRLPPFCLQQNQFP